MLLTIFYNINQIYTISSSCSKFFIVESFLVALILSSISVWHGISFVILNLLNNPKFAETITNIMIINHMMQIYPPLRTYIEPSTC